MIGVCLGGAQVERAMFMHVRREQIKEHINGSVRVPRTEESDAVCIRYCDTQKHVWDLV